MIMALEFVSIACSGFLDAYLPKSGWRGEGLGLPTGQGTCPLLGLEGGGWVSGGVGGKWENGRK